MVTLAIQAGGESRRMGSDKALLPFMGKPLILQPLQRLVPLADEVIITANQPEKYKFLGLTPFPDIFPGLGALGGLFTALSVASHPYVVVVACDMPFANLALFAAQLNLLRESGTDAIIPRSETGTEPFHAIYRRDTCLPFVRSALESGQRRVDSWFLEANIRYLEPEETQTYDPQGLAFLNINTIEELREAEIIAMRVG
jgi:molybdopterin-guanine dinucleotide biosynthesis protein A